MTVRETQSMWHVPKSRNETSGVDTKESWYQFMKPAGSNTSQNTLPCQTPSRIR